MSSALIRESGPADLAVLATLHCECFPDDPWGPAAMAEVLDMPGAFALMSFEPSQSVPTGFLVALDLVVEFEILAFGVLPTARRRGFGRSLLAQLLATASQRPVILEVAEDNAAARALYEGLGFGVVGRRAGYYRRRSGPPIAALALRRPGSP